MDNKQQSGWLLSSLLSDYCVFAFPLLVGVYVHSYQKMRKLLNIV